MSGETVGDLRFYTNEDDFVIASSVDEAISLWEEQHGLKGNTNVQQ